MHSKIHPESSPETKIWKHYEKFTKSPDFRYFSFFFFVFWFRKRIRGVFWDVFWGSEGFCVLHGAQEIAKQSLIHNTFEHSSVTTVASLQKERCWLSDWALLSVRVRIGIKLWGGLGRLVRNVRVPFCLRFPRWSFNQATNGTVLRNPPCRTQNHSKPYSDKEITSEMAQHGTSICRACETGNGVNDICTTTTQRARKESLQREAGSIHPYGRDGRAGKLPEPYVLHSDSLDWQVHFRGEGSPLWRQTLSFSHGEESRKLMTLKDWNPSHEDCAPLGARTCATVQIHCHNRHLNSPITSSKLPPEWLLLWPHVLIWQK